MAARIVDGAITLEIKLVVVAFDRNECEIGDGSMMKKVRVFFPKLAERTSVVWREGKWAYVINLSGITNSDLIQRNMISLLLGDELSWSSPHVEELETAFEQIGVLLLSPDPLSPRDDERTRDVNRWNWKKCENKKLVDSAVNCYPCHLTHNFTTLLGTREYKTFEANLLREGIVTFPERKKVTETKSLGPCYWACPEEGRLSEAYEVEKTVITLKSTSLSDTAYSVARHVSDNYTPLPSKRYFGIKLTVVAETVKYLQDRDKLPEGVVWSTDKVIETISKENMDLEELRELIDAFGASVHVNHRHQGWLTISRPDKSTMHRLLGGISEQEEAWELTYWRNIMTFEANENYGSTEILEIAKYLLLDEVPSHEDKLLELRVQDRLDIE